MELLSTRQVIEEGWPFFSEAHQNRYYESGLYIKPTAWFLTNLTLSYLDQNLMWTSADAQCSTKLSKSGSKTNCFGVTWCSNGKKLKKTKNIHMPSGDRRDLCLTYEPRQDRFRFKSCRSSYYFVCEVKQNRKFGNIKKITFLQHKCTNVFCPEKNQCLINVK